MIKKIGLLSIIFICIVIAFGSLSFANDSVSPWAEEAVNKMDNIGVIGEKIKVNYKKNITREEFTNIIIPTIEKMIGSSMVVSSNSNAFKDTTNENILKAASAGIVGGISADKFDPNGSLTREQAAAIFSRSLNYLNQNKNVKRNTQITINFKAPLFADDKLISSWAKEAVANSYNNGIISGVGSNKFNPKGNLTVEQTITISFRLYDNFRDLDAKDIVLEITEDNKSETKTVDTNQNNFSIKNIYVEKAIRNSLRKPTGDLTKADFDSVTNIYIDQSNDNNFSDLEKFKNLEDLTITNSKLKNIEFVKNLTNLKTLSVIFNDIEDLTPLKSLPKLEFFDGSNNNIKTVEPVLTLSNIKRFYVWENPNLKDLQRLNENNEIGMGDFQTLEAKADFLKMVDETIKSFNQFFVDLPNDADALTKYMYVYLKLSNIEANNNNYTDRWYKRLNSGNLNFIEKNIAFANLCKYVKVNTGYASTINYFINNDIYSEDKISLNVFKLNGNNLYTSFESSYHLLSDEKVYESLTGQVSADLSYLPNYEISTSKNLSAYDFGLNAYANLDFEKTNYYKNNDDLFVFRSFYDATNMFDINQIGSGQTINKEYKNLFSSYISFDENYGLYYLNDRKIVRYDLKTKERKIIKENADFVGVYKDKLVYADYSTNIGLYVSDLDGSNTKTIHSGQVILPNEGGKIEMSNNIFYFSPRDGQSRNGYYKFKAYDVISGQTTDLSTNKISFKIINNYLLTWEEGYKNYKIMKNDGSQVKNISSLDNGLKTSTLPIADRLYLSQGGSFIELKNDEYMVDFDYISDKNMSGK